jgi:hypothetical protein
LTALFYAGFCLRVHARSIAKVRNARHEIPQVDCLNDFSPTVPLRWLIRSAP